MGQGVVKSTPEAITAIDNMKKTINGGLLESINTFVTYGDSLNPENFAGSQRRPVLHRVARDEDGPPERGRPGSG